MLGVFFCIKHGPASRNRFPSRPVSLIAIGAILLVAGFSASANDSDRSNSTIEQEEANRVQVFPESMVVYGRARQQLGAATSASEGRVAGADLELRPRGRVGELLEVVPGLIATEHSRQGKSNQLFLRGFNLDHGTDFAAHLDGVPLNFRTHGHGQGYLDLNFLIPEIVESVDFRKGPYRADVGDFSSGCSSFMRTVASREKRC